MTGLFLRLLPDLPHYERGAGPTIAQAVIIKDGPRGREVLLVKRTSPRAWEPPGGNVEPGEHPEETVVREVREETGLDVTVDRLVGWYWRSGFRPHRAPVYVCTVVGGTLERNWEAVDIAYFPVAGLPWGLFPWYRSVIRDAISGVTYPAGRRQHLGLPTVIVSGLIHLAERAGVLR